MSLDRATRLAVERLDVLENPLPKKGCNARSVSGRMRCGQKIVHRSWGPFDTERRLCQEHVDLYAAHDRMLGAIYSA